jgi:hypothetical protein
VQRRPAHINWRNGLAQRKVAPSAYREVVINGAYHSGSYQGAFERLERLDAKVSRAVLRGRGGGNAALLPDLLLTDSDLVYNSGAASGTALLFLGRRE